MQQRLAETVARILEERFAGVKRAMARAIGTNDEDTVVSQVSAVIDGRAGIPKKHIEAWADALGLKGDARRQFVELAWLDHAPQEVAQLVDRLRADLAKMRDERIKILAQRDEVIALLRARGDKLPERFKNL